MVLVTVLSIAYDRLLLPIIRFRFHGRRSGLGYNVPKVTTCTTPELPVTRPLILTLLAIVLSVPLMVTARSGATPPAASDALADPDVVVAALESATPPETLSGNVDEEIRMVTWEAHYDEELAGTLGAWVFTGSPQLPIALLMVFETPEDARAGIEGYVRDTNVTIAGDLEAWTIADRGKWVCVTADGPVVIFGQAEPQPDESDDDVRQRSCAVVHEMHRWLVEQTQTGATPS